MIFRRGTCKCLSTPLAVQGTLSRSGSRCTSWSPAPWAWTATTTGCEPEKQCKEYRICTTTGSSSNLKHKTHFKYPSHCDESGRNKSKSYVNGVPNSWHSRSRAVTRDHSRCWDQAWAILSKPNKIPLLKSQYLSGIGIEGVLISHALILWYWYWDRNWGIPFSAIEIETEIVEC